MFAAARAIALADIVVDDRLYATDADTILRIVRTFSDKRSIVLLFGHNPELTDVAHRLTSQLANVPTCAVVELGFNVDSWSRIGSVVPARIKLDYPKKA